MTNLEKVLSKDLALALWLIQGYQRSLYTLNAPDPQRAKSGPLLTKYKLESAKIADGYKIVVEDERGEMFEISDPENPESLGSKQKFWTDYQTGKTKIVNDNTSYYPKDGLCPTHHVPLGEDNDCHRCHDTTGDTYDYKWQPRDRGLID